MTRFSEGMKVFKVHLPSGIRLIVDTPPLIAAGRVREMTIEMQPGPAGDMPWIRVVGGEEGASDPDGYINMAMVESVVLQEEIE